MGHLLQLIEHVNILYSVPLVDLSTMCQPSLVYTEPYPLDVTYSDVSLDRALVLGI